MSFKIIITSLILFGKTVFADQSEFHEALSKYLALVTSQRVVLYRTPLSPVRTGTYIQEQESANFLLNFIPADELAADEPPKKSLTRKYEALVYSSRAGVARWKDKDITAYEEARRVVLRPQNTADLLRGHSIAFEHTVRADAYLRRTSQDGYSPDKLTKIEDAVVSSAFKLVEDGGPAWPINHRLRAIDKSSNTHIQLTPSPGEIASSNLWTQLDLSSVTGKPVRIVDMLLVNVTFDCIDEEFLRGSYWDCDEADLRQRGLSLPIATGKPPAKGVSNSEIPWLPRKLILLRPSTVVTAQPLSPLTPLNVDGICAVGLIVELLEPLPKFDATLFHLQDR
jgi:hypothetical protein